MAAPARCGRDTGTTTKQFQSANADFLGRRERGLAKALGPGWHLATITSAEEDEFVKGLLGSPFSSTVTSRKYWTPRHLWLEFGLGPWIGGYRAFGSETFQWVTGEPVLLLTCTPAPDSPAVPHRSPTLITTGGFAGSIGWDFPHSAFPSFLPIAYVAELSAPPANPGLELTAGHSRGLQKRDRKSEHFQSCASGRLL